MIDATAAIPAINNSSKTERLWRAAIMRPPRAGAASIGGGQPPHRELDPPVGQFAPAFDLGHVGGLGKPAEYLARLFARLLARQRERLAAERIGFALAQRLRGAARDVCGSSAGTH